MNDNRYVLLYTRVADSNQMCDRGIGTSPPLPHSIRRHHTHTHTHTHTHMPACRRTHQMNPFGCTRGSRELEACYRKRQDRMCEPLERFAAGDAHIVQNRPPSRDERPRPAVARGDARGALGQLLRIQAARGLVRLGGGVGGEG